MKDQLESLLRVARALDDLQIPYLVVGSVASSLHGFSRATADADVVADVQPAQVRPLFEALKEDFYIDDLMVGRAVSNRRPFNVINFDTLFKIDIYPPADDDFSRQQLGRRQQVRLLPDSEQVIHLATPEDTILAKLRWHQKGGGASGRQLEDVAGVIKVQGARLDLAYLREWAGRLNVGDLLERALGEAGARGA
jgi:hypothetical protein